MASKPNECVGILADGKRCGRKVIVRLRRRDNTVTYATSDNHDLCQRCWKAEINRVWAEKLAGS